MTATLPAAPGDELLDHPDADPAAVRRSLHHIARSNWWFGGWWAVRRGLARVLERAGVGPGDRVTVVDVGCGSGDLLEHAVRWAARRGVRLVPIGIERHPMAAALARTGGAPSVLASADHLPLRERGADILLVSQLLHHFAPGTIVECCRAAARSARLGLVVADLRRSPAAAAGFWLGARLLRFDECTRRDGLTSIRRGFSRVELHALLARAGLEARVERSPGFRLVATWLAERG